MKARIWHIHKEKNINRICKLKISFHDSIVVRFCRARRAARENQQSTDIVQPIKPHYEVRKFIKIGRPGYKGRINLIFTRFNCFSSFVVTKQRDPGKDNTLIKIEMMERIISRYKTTITSLSNRLS